MSRKVLKATQNEQASQLPCEYAGELRLQAGGVRRFPRTSNPEVLRTQNKNPNKNPEPGTRNPERFRFWPQYYRVATVPTDLSDF